MKVDALRTTSITSAINDPISPPPPQQQQPELL